MYTVPERIYSENEDDIRVMAGISYYKYASVNNSIDSAMGGKYQMSEEKILEGCGRWADKMSAVKCECGGSVRFTLKGGFELSHQDKCFSCLEADRIRDRQLDPLRDKDGLRKESVRHEVKAENQDPASRQFFQSIAMAGGLKGI